MYFQFELLNHGIVSLITGKSLKSFKTRLDKFWYTQDTVYDFEAPLSLINNRTGTRDFIVIDYENKALITEEHKILPTTGTVLRYPKVRYYYLLFYEKLSFQPVGPIMLLPVQGRHI